MEIDDLLLCNQIKTFDIRIDRDNITQKSSCVRFSLLKLFFLENFVVERYFPCNVVQKENDRAYKYLRSTGVNFTILYTFISQCRTNVFWTIRIDAKW